MRLAFALVVLGTFAAEGEGRLLAQMKTFDGKHSIDQIDLKVVYFVPKDRTPLTDWRARVDYFRDRIAAFHEREFQGRSKLTIDIHPEPFRSSKTTAELRDGTADRIFFETLGEAARSDTIGFDAKRKRKTAFPILLVLSEINWRPLDDFYRLRPTNRGPEFEGTYQDGLHAPGAAAGGARAIYDSGQGFGWGLVSADGWRVPYRGSDCVIYHEGLGHTIGLPHPEPGDASVMSGGQYNGWLNQAWIDAEQKKQLGWTPRDDFDAENPGLALFSAFTADVQPRVPTPNVDAEIRLTWPENVQVRQCDMEIQTEVYGPWVRVFHAEPGPPPKRIALPRLSAPTPVSFRIKAVLDDEAKVELWGYFQVRENPDEPPRPVAPSVDLASPPAAD